MLYVVEILMVVEEQLSCILEGRLPGTGFSLGTTITISKQHARFKMMGKSNRVPQLLG